MAGRFQLNLKCEEGEFIIIDRDFDTILINRMPQRGADGDLTTRGLSCADFSTEGYAQLGDATDDAIYINSHIVNR